MEKDITGIEIENKTLISHDSIHSSNQNSNAAKTIEQN